MHKKQIEMKTFRNIVIAVSLGLLAVSCTAFEDDYDDDFADSSWYGEYYAGPDEILGDLIYITILHFGDDGQVCTVFSGVKGAIGFSDEKYDVQWSSRNTFALTQTAGGQTVVYYSGKIAGKKMTLDAFSCYQVELTIQLKEAG